MRQAFKFVEKQHIESLLGGTFRFGRLRYYKLLEMIYADSLIGDRFEGASLATANVDLGASTDPAVLGRMKPFISVTGDSFVMVRDVRVSNEIDGFVLCLTLRSDDSISAEYDGCISIRDADEFAALLRASSAIRPSREELIKLLFRILREHTEMQRRDLESDPSRLPPEASDADWAQQSKVYYAHREALSKEFDAKNSRDLYKCL